MNTLDTLAQNPQLTQHKIDVTAMKRFGRLEEVAAAVLWLFSDAVAYITGAIISVGGGISAGKSLPSQ